MRGSGEDQDAPLVLGWRRGLPAVVLGGVRRGLSERAMNNVTQSSMERSGLYEMAQFVEESVDGLTLEDLQALVCAAQTRAAQQTALKVKEELDDLYSARHELARDDARRNGRLEERQWLWGNVVSQLDVILHMIATPNRKRSDITERVQKLRDTVSARHFKDKP